MTIEINTPAFPFVAEDESGTMINIGMTLRDYFAAKALQGICANPDDGHDPEIETYDEYIKDVVKDSYEIADAMLKARK